MISKLLATTAVVSLSTSLALANTQPANNDGPKDAMTMYDVRTLGDVGIRGYLASNLIGQSVYTRESENAEMIGDINDVVISEDGQINAVIVGVGGFLGISEREVAIAFGRVNIAGESGGDKRIWADVTRAELQAAEPYERPDWASWDSVRQAADQLAGDASNVYQDTVSAVGDGIAGPASADSNDTISETERQAWLDGKWKFELSAAPTNSLVGATIYTERGKPMGDVDEIVMEGPNRLKGVVVDIGGFLGFGEKAVIVDSDKFTIYRDNAGDLHLLTTMTETQFKAAPPYEPLATTAG